MIAPPFVFIVVRICRRNNNHFTHTGASGSGAAGAGGGLRGSMAPITSGSLSAVEVFESWDETSDSMSEWKGLKVGVSLFGDC
jgi:hypothetical protein